MSEYTSIAQSILASLPTPTLAGGPPVSAAEILKEHSPEVLGEVMAGLRPDHQGALFAEVINAGDLYSTWTALDAGINPNFPGPNGRYPLVSAVLAPKDAEKIENLLLNKGADRDLAATQMKEALLEDAVRLGMGVERLTAILDRIPKVDANRLDQIADNLGEFPSESAWLRCRAGAIRNDLRSDVGALHEETQLLSEVHTLVNGAIAAGRYGDFDWESAQESWDKAMGDWERGAWFDAPSAAAQLLAAAGDTDVVEHPEYATALCLWTTDLVDRVITKARSGERDARRASSVILKELAVHCADGRPGGHDFTAMCEASFEKLLPFGDTCRSIHDSAGRASSTMQVLVSHNRATLFGKAISQLQFGASEKKVEVEGEARPVSLLDLTGRQENVACLNVLLTSPQCPDSSKLRTWLLAHPESAAPIKVSMLQAISRLKKNALSGDTASLAPAPREQQELLF